MDEVAFVPDERARALASGRSRTIGLLLANLTSPYTADLIRSLQVEARREGYAILLMDTGYGPSEEGEAAQTLRQKRVDGVVAIPYGESPDQLRPLLQAGIPTVFVARYFAAEPSDVVRHDNRQTGYLAVKHLIDLGHRRILYVNRQAAISTVADRLAGVGEALAEAGLDPSTVTTCDAMVTAAGGYAAVQAAGRPFPYTAVVAYNDYCALGVQRALAEAGYRVPHDISLVACSDTGIGAYLPVRLTAIQEDWTDVGKQALQLLLRRMQGGGEPPCSIVLPTQLVVRDSTVPPS